MQALFFDGRTPRLTDRPPPEPADGMAIVRVELAGVCNTDLEIARGYMDFEGILGHEFVGLVEEGPASWHGARVVGEINFACGRCEACAAGLGRHCAARRVMGILAADGAFAERVAVPVANLHRVPDGVTSECAVFAEPLAAAFEILEQVPVEADQHCVVLGDGKLGLLVAQVLADAGAKVLAVGRHADKLALLSGREIETCPVDDFRAESAQADLVVEATGSGAGLELALAATRPRGTVILKSTVAERPAVDLAPVVIHEIQVLGSRCGPFEPALAALRDDRIDVTSLVTDTYPLSRAPAALEATATPGTLKLLLTC